MTLTFTFPRDRHRGTSHVGDRIVLMVEVDERVLRQGLVSLYDEDEHAIAHGDLVVHPGGRASLHTAREGETPI